MALRRKQDNAPLDDGWSSHGISMLRMLPDLAVFLEGFCVVHVGVTATIHFLPDHVKIHALFDCMDRWVGGVVFAKSF